MSIDHVALAVVPTSKELICEQQVPGVDIDGIRGQPSIPPTAVRKEETMPESRMERWFLFQGLLSLGALPFGYHEIAY